MLSQEPPLRFSLSVPLSARVGERVPVVLRLTNTSNRPVEAHFVGRTIAFDIIVESANGAVVWRRLGEGAGQSILQLKTMAPGETIEWRDHWVPKAAGHYRIQGRLPSDAGDRLTAWAHLEVR
jgi:hypothetical protein